MAMVRSYNEIISVTLNPDSWPYLLRLKFRLVLAGFLPLLAGTAVGAIWGDGTYFARDAKYSDGGYANTLPNGQKQMMIVDVLIGRTTKGSKGMKKPPLVPGKGPYTHYNAFVDDEAHPSIFVIQYSNQAYPLYVITYHT